MPKWLDKILGLEQLKQSQNKNFELLNNSFASFSHSFSGNAYQSEIYRAAVDAIARHMAKLSGKHVVNRQKESDPYSKLNRILQDRPNPYMSGYDFLYKITTHYYLYNNAFIYVQKDDRGNVSGLYPLTPNNVEYVVDGSNQMYIKFLFTNGEDAILPFNDVAVLRRHYNSNELFGDDNSAIMSALELAHTQQEGMSESIKNGATIRGVLQYQQALSPSKLKEAKEEFTNNYLSMANNGGVIPLDTSMEYKPLNHNDVKVDTSQTDAVKKKIYDYLGISENIVNGTYNEDGWQSFFESIIEPFAIQLSSELTEKIFTEREKAFSNRIIYESSKLQYASNKSKTNVIKELLPMGILTTNQALDLLNLPRVEDGDQRILSLNYIDKDIAAQYQLNKGDENSEGN